ncbi:hypothetical protein BpHYR1_000374 [Brachionus plicatilis]|uniref:Uncharacterized protein n=1 Tax=Brachionus plicatilis TaxID=10195 RepID=A0A3M7Q545_BRAPC|nr:hypothetical protein BpHYR1_000374 [Brachionus plicatilis]
MSPVFTLSKKPMSWSISERKTNFLKRTFSLATAMDRKHVRIPPNIPLAKFAAMNRMAFFLNVSKFFFTVMVSSTCPL